MRAFATKSVFVAVFPIVVWAFPTAASAQLSDATSAFKGAVRKAQRLFGNQSRLHPRKSLRQSIHTGKSETVAPKPAANPVQTQLPSAETIANAKQAKPTAVGIPLAGTNAKTTATPQAAAPAQAPKKVAPPPDTWTTKQVQTAMKACRKILRGVRAEVSPVAPVKKGPCGEAAPVRLTKLTGPRTVVFSPAPIVNCRMVRALDTWMRRGLQPLAQKRLGAAIVKVTVMSSYSCRNAYGRTSTRLSEHGKANALDIGSFVTADGARTTLLADWGPTERDIIAAAKKAPKEQRSAPIKPGATDKGTSQAKAPLPAAAATDTTPAGAVPQSQATQLPTPPAPAYIASVPRRIEPIAQDGIDSLPRWREKSGRPPTPTPTLATTPQPVKPNPPVVHWAGSVDVARLHPPIPERRPSLRQRWAWKKAAQAKRRLVNSRKSRNAYRDQLNNFLSYRNDLGGPKLKDGQDKRSQQRPPSVNRAAFLRGAHRTACRIFGTVLGPEANNAHRNHFHVDLAKRRRNNYCR